MRKSLFRSLWFILLVIALSIVVFGAKRGEWKKIKTNAEYICTSCIGLGK
ncbi:hypothetical protein H5T87_04245 [bacterium]|nr:hypothetical protein [bacterium]